MEKYFDNKWDTCPVKSCSLKKMGCVEEEDKLTSNKYTDQMSMETLTETKSWAIKVSVTNATGIDEKVCLVCKNDDITVLLDNFPVKADPVVDYTLYIIGAAIVVVVVCAYTLCCYLICKARL